MDVQSSGFKNTLVALGPIVIFMVMIFFLFRSQQKENKRKQEMIKSIKSGDKVITAGGIHGVVANVKENTFIVKIADNVKIEVNKSGVVSVMEKDVKESK
jgi:preprotein translocase subunit YajC